MTPDAPRRPAVSVVIPTYNRAGFIAEAIESCFAAADGLDVQVVVVDDASTDATPSIVGRYPVEYIRLEKNGGRIAARNAGKARCSGGFVKFLDSDDTLEPGTLRREFELATEHDAAMVAGGWHVSRRAETGHETIASTHRAPAFDDNIDCILAGKAVPTGAALYRRDYIEDVRWEPVGPLDDWDFFIHAAIKGGKIASLPDPVYRWRQHAGERASGKPMVVTAECFYRILDRLLVALESTGRLTDARRKRLAQYYYKELRVLFRFAPEYGKVIEARIFSLDPAFVPRDEERSATIRLLARVVRLRWLLVSYGVGRRALDRLHDA